MGFKWVIKAIVQKVISFLPLSHRINYFFQKHVTGGIILDDAHFGLKFQHARDHLLCMNERLDGQEAARVLELGTGWYPVVPLLFYLSGAEEVVSVDIRSWMTARTQRLTVEKYREWKEKGLLEEIWPLVDQQRWESLMALYSGNSSPDRDRFNSHIRLRPVVGDARSLDLHPGSVDFVCSNNTFEHIPAPVLRDILLEFKRVLRPGGWMSHFVDMSDHFAHFDPRITIYNFLRFSAKRWQQIDNSIQPQNRLRLCDYREMYAELNIGVEEEDVRPGQVEELDRIRVHPEFKEYTREELAVSHVSLISPGATRP
jgi:SAM-dependent methyltransferase